MPLAYDPAVAVAHLLKRDKPLAKLIRGVPFTLEPPRGITPFESLLKAIVSQQLSGKAAIDPQIKFRTSSVERQVGAAEEGLQSGRCAADSAESFEGDLVQMFHVAGGEVRQAGPLQVLPDLLHRIEFRRIRR